MGLSNCPIFVAFSSYLFGLRRLFRDLQPDIQIASISQQFTHHESWKEENLTLQSTSLRYMFLNSKMPFGSGFVFSRINTTELIFYQLLLSLGRSLKLIWIVFVIRNFSFALQRLWCTVFQLDSNTFIFPKTGRSVDMQDFFFCFKIATTYLFSFCFFPHEMGETGRLPGKDYMFVCAIILLFENRFIFLVCLTQPCKLTCSEQRFGRLEVFNDQIESLPLAQGVSCLCKFGL